MTKEEQKLALKYARDAIREYLQNDKAIPAPKDGIFGKKGAVFVTLHTKQNHSLRGCIGTIIAYRTLGEDLIAHAVDAAVNDPRFDSLLASELDGIEIEISVLTEPKELDYKNTQDMLSKIRIGIDGVVIRYDGYGATFLPTVWEQIPDKELFFAHLCQKAGLSYDFYKTGKLQVFLYQSESFSE